MQVAVPLKSNSEGAPEFITFCLQSFPFSVKLQNVVNYYRTDSLFIWTLSTSLYLLIFKWISFLNFLFRFGFLPPVAVNFIWYISVARKILFLNFADVVNFEPITVLLSGSGLVLQLAILESQNHKVWKRAIISLRTSISQHQNVQY